MTNILFTVALTLSTNWTGLNYDGKGELGILQTNHVATIVYEGRTNNVTLKTDTGESVWRPYVPKGWNIPSGWYVTNLYFPSVIETPFSK